MDLSRIHECHVQYLECVLYIMRGKREELEKTLGLLRAITNEAAETHFLINWRWTPLKLSKKILYMANKRSGEKKQIFWAMEDCKEKQQEPLSDGLM